MKKIILFNDNESEFRHNTYSAYYYDIFDLIDNENIMIECKRNANIIFGINKLIAVFGEYYTTRNSGKKIYHNIKELSEKEMNELKFKNPELFI